MYTHPIVLRLRRQAMQLDATKTLSRREIAQRCQMSHTILYKILRRYEEQGDAGLYDKERTPKVWPNQTPADVEESTLAFVQEQPNWGPRRISNELKKTENGGIKVGETAVYGVLKRNDLNTRQKRLKWIRVLGALYRIPLAHMLGAKGMAFYVLPNQIYYLFFALSTAGIPVALASIISEKIAMGHYRDALRTFRVARAAMFLLGLTFFLLLFASAGWLIDIGLVVIPEAYLGMQVVAPVIFFAAVVAVYRGLFQGFSNMRVVAYSQVFEQVMLVAASLVFSYLLLPRGLEIAAAGANFGAVPGVVGATLMLAFLYRMQRRDILQMAQQDLTGVREGTFSLLKRIFSVALPISFAGMVMSVSTIIDQNLIVSRLQLAGFNYSQAAEQYGEFTGMAMAFINISTVLAASLGTSLVPATAESLAVKNLVRIKTQLSQAMRLALIFALPAATGLFLLAHQLTLLVFADKGAGVPLTALAAAVVFWSMHLVTAGVLQGMNKAGISVRNLLVGIVIKVLITYYFTPTPLGIQAAALGTVAIFFVSSLLNIIYLSRMVGFQFNTIETVLKPGLATVIMSLCVLEVYQVTFQQWGGNTWPTLLAVCAGIVVYPMVLVALGGIRSEEVRRLPIIGDRTAIFLQRLGR